jgi:hypothetical protein
MVAAVAVGVVEASCDVGRGRGEEAPSVTER